jgi:hypothetical protein
MFSLIITIISIALVAALALATLYFGGDAFNQGSAKASASTLVNQASQINGANTLYFLDNQAYSDMSGLVPNFLAATPNPGTAGDAYAIDQSGTGLAGKAGGITSQNIPVAVCNALNEQSGAPNTIAWAADITHAGVAANLAALDDVQFGCFADSSANVTGFTFVYK